MSDETTAPYTMQARPTTYRGIEMRSRLEARFASLLDRWGITWEYEPRCYADESGQYLPDFATHGWHLPRSADNPGGALKAPVFFETKPLALIDGAVQRRMQIIRSSEPTAVLAVWAPETIGFPLCPPGSNDFKVGVMSRCVFCGRMFIRMMDADIDRYLSKSCYPSCVIDGSLATVNADGEWWRDDDGFELFQAYD